MLIKSDKNLSDALKEKSKDFQFGKGKWKIIKKINWPARLILNPGSEVEYEGRKMASRIGIMVNYLNGYTENLGEEDTSWEKHKDE